MVCKPLERLDKLYELNSGTNWQKRDLNRLVCDPDRHLLRKCDEGFLVRIEIAS